MQKMKVNHKEKLPLFVGIGLPILLITYILITVYLPTLFVKPRYNFIYTSGCDDTYTITVTSGKITYYPRYNQYNAEQRIFSTPNCFYIYDVSQDNNRPIQLTQAQAYTLDPSSKSPDGFTITQNNESSGDYFPFFWYGSGDTSGQYIRGNGLNKKIAEDTYSYDFKFIGWVLK